MFSVLLRIVLFILWVLFWFMIGWMIGFSLTTIGLRRGARRAWAVDDLISADATEWVA